MVLCLSIVLEESHIHMVLGIFSYMFLSRLFYLVPLWLKTSPVKHIQSEQVSSLILSFWIDHFYEVWRITSKCSQNYVKLTKENQKKTCRVRKAPPVCFPGRRMYGRRMYVRMSSTVNKIPPEKPKMGIPQNPSWIFFCFFLFFCCDPQMRKKWLRPQMRLCYKQMLNKIYHKKKKTQPKKTQQKSHVYKIPPKTKKKVHDLKTLAQPLVTTPCPLTYPVLPTHKSPLSGPHTPCDWFMYVCTSSYVVVVIEQLTKSLLK